MSAPPAQQQAGALPKLDYSRTVDRYLVHRDALGEVFLTDLQPLGPRDNDSYAAAAQLPRSHAYYGDHLLRPSCYDPMLILEATRQATIAGAHRFFGVAEDAKFILTHLRLRLAHPRWVAVGSSPLPLAMRVTALTRKEREGRTTGIDYGVELSAGDRVVGHVETGLRFKAPTDYLSLRLGHRDGRPLPSSATLPQTAPGTPAPPHLVGRASADNVVLVNAIGAEHRGRALLRTPVDHPSLFDHPQDHLPGMVIAEGARQLALFTAHEARGISPAKAFPTALDVRFERFGELEEETLLAAQAGQEVRVQPADRGVYYTQGGVLELEEAKPDEVLEQVPVRVEARQGTARLCTIDLTLTRVSDQ
jgi:2-oxo-3-(phosphooxy)propyl 3-oxoalkanoate synthase